jgi:hypothetical protein
LLTFPVSKLLPPNLEIFNRACKYILIISECQDFMNPDIWKELLFLRSIFFELQITKNCTGVFVGYQYESIII